MNIPAGTYRIKRGTQEFGPYDSGSLQRYIESGNIVMTDLVEANGSGLWIPLEQLVGYQDGATTPSPVAPSPYMPQPGSSPYTLSPDADSVELPPNLHWVLILVLGIVPFFSLVWGFILAGWAKKLNGTNAPLVGLIVATIGYVIYFVTLFSAGREFAGFFMLMAGIARLVAMFSVRSSMEEYYNTKENIGLTLSGVMTFFFSQIYFQYHINRISRWKQTGFLA